MSSLIGLHVGVTVFSWQLTPKNSCIISIGISLAKTLLENWDLGVVDLDECFCCSFLYSGFEFQVAELKEETKELKEKRLPLITHAMMPLDFEIYNENLLG